MAADVQLSAIEGGGAEQTIDGLETRKPKECEWTGN